MYFKEIAQGVHTYGVKMKRVGSMFWVFDYISPFRPIFTSFGKEDGSSLIYSVPFCLPNSRRGSSLRGEKSENGPMSNRNTARLSVTKRWLLRRNSRCRASSDLHQALHADYLFLRPSNTLMRIVWLTSNLIAGYCWTMHSSFSNKVLTGETRLYGHLLPRVSE